jgi:hypothetical protein
MASRVGSALKVAVGLVVLATLAWSTPAKAACGYLPTNSVKYATWTMYSCDNRFMLAMQNDGNLVVYEGSRALWASNTAGYHPGARVAMQGDGNLVLYDNYGAYWATYRYGANAYLAMQTDGNLVVYSGSGQPLWASNVYYTDGVLAQAGSTSDCIGRCGAGCGGWMPFGGNIYTSECRAHDECVAAHGFLYPECIYDFGVAAISYLVQVGKNLISKAWNAIAHFFHW